LKEINPDLCTSLSSCQGGDYCRECSHSLFFGEVFVNDKKWTFEFSPQFGPMFTNKDGEPKKVQPAEKNPVWDEFQKWYDKKFKQQED